MAQNNEKPKLSMFSEVTQADSSLYEKYQLRPYNPDALYQKRGNYDYYDDMRQDDQISAVSSLKKLMIIDCGWEIECWEVNKRGNKKEFEEGIKFVEWNFRENLCTLFDSKQLEILTGKDYGFSLSEKIYKVKETDLFGQKIVLHNLRTRPPHTFDFDQDNHGNILKVIQDTTSGKLYIEPIKFLHYINNPEFDNPFGQSDYNEGVYRNYWSKDMVIKYLNIFIERFGMPTVVGKYPRSDIAHKAKFKKLLKNIQAKTSMVIPDEFMVELLQKSGQSGESVFERAINYYNMMIARKMLVPDLMGFSGTEVQGGSYALGSEHFEIFYSLIEYDRNFLANLYTKNIVEPLIHWNYGPKYKCKFKFNPVDIDKKHEQAKLWLEAVKTGKIESSESQWQHFLKQIEYPEITEKDKNEQQKQIAVDVKFPKNKPEENGPDNIPNQTNENIPNGIDDKEEQNKNELCNCSESHKYEIAEMKTRMEKAKSNPIEKKVKFNTIAKESMKIDDKYIEIIGNTAKLIINGLIDDIRRKKIIEKKKISEVNKLQPKNLNKLQKDFENLMKESFKLGIETAEKPKTKKNIIEVTQNLTDAEFLDLAVSEAFALTKSFSDDILSIIQPEVFNAIKQGLGTSEAIKAIDNTLKGYNIDITGEGHKIERIVRTTSSRFFNDARDREFNKAKDDIIGWWYSIVLDNRTSDICRALDSNDQGMYRPEMKSTIQPPNHPNCRSMLVPVFREESEEISKVAAVPSVDELSGGFLKLNKEK